MALSHSSCTHPSTSSARSACRAKGGPDGTATPKAATATAAPAKPKAEKVAEANAKRTAATKAKNPRKDRRDCYLCGKPSAHAEIKSGEPVCLKHIADTPGGWDNIRCLPL